MEIKPALAQLVILGISWAWKIKLAVLALGSSAHILKMPRRSFNSSFRIQGPPSGYDYNMDFLHIHMKRALIGIKLRRSSSFP